MSKSEPDNEFFAPKTGSQQVVFDYLESLLEDPDTLAHDTMEELKAIGALEHAEPKAGLVVEDVVPGSAVDEGILEEPDAVREELPQDAASEIEDAVAYPDAEPELLMEDDLPVADVFSEPEPSFEELELVDTPADLMGAEPEVSSCPLQVDIESDPAPESELEMVEPEGLTEPEIPQVAIEPAVMTEQIPSAPESAPEPIQASEPAIAPAVDNTPKPALHVAEDVLNCILFQLQGLTLAIPVDDVEGAVSMERLTLHFDMDHDWVLGFFDAMGKETSVVDTGNWLLPGRFDASQANYEEVLILKGRRWALACDTLVKSMRMQHSDIVWAGENKSRPWLLGTNMAERCAILDVDKLQMLLNQQA